MTHKAIDVARFLLRLADDEDESQPLTNLHIQKLLYLAQGWHLALHGRPLFDDPIEAWRYGPMVPSVYSQYSKAGRGAVNDPAAPGPLDEPAAALVRQVWRRYQTYSGFGLAEITHSHAPWQEAWSRRSDPNRSSEEIPRGAIEEHFRRLLRELQGPLTAADVERSRRELAAGEWITLEELKAEHLSA